MKPVVRALVVGLVAAAVGCSIYNSSLLTTVADGGGPHDAGHDAGLPRDAGHEAHTDAGADVKTHDAGVDSGITPHASCLDGGDGVGNQCGPNETDDCCATLPVPGGTFLRNLSDAGPATVSTFSLDQYEVTVGRFRKFVNAGYGTQLKPPTAGSGANPHIPGSGWSSSWNTLLPASTPVLTSQALTCNQDSSANPTWTDTVSNNESLPINCITWIEAFAFCTWDGGRLPTDTEWDYAASGGSQERYYPWSSPPTSSTITPAYASYYCTGHGGPTQFVDGGMEAGIFYCSVADITRPGHHSPLGDGRYGHADLGGNMDEWVLDWNFANFILPCDNCAELEAGPPDAGVGRLIRGGGYYDTPNDLFTSQAFYADPSMWLDDEDGIRCARDP